MYRKAKWYASKKVLFTFISVFLISVLGGYYAMNSWFFETPEENYTLPDGTVVKSKRVNLLLMGIDARPGEKNTRTDTMIFASIDPETNSATVISIPRDTRVKIAGKGYQKINNANVFGGTELAQKTVENLLGVPVHYYVLTNFDGFKDIIDTLGGLTLDVEKRMYYPDEGINLRKGVQTLDGDKALQYVRFRSDALGDIGRTQRQQKFLKALASEVLQVRNVTKLPKLIPQISRAVQTNMSVTEMAKMASLAKNIDSQKIVAQTLPGNFATINGGSYWAVNEEKVKSFVKDIMISGITSDVVDESVANKPSRVSGSGEKDEHEPKETSPVADPTPPKVKEPVTPIPPTTSEGAYGNNGGNGGNGNSGNGDNSDNSDKSDNSDSSDNSDNSSNGSGSDGVGTDPNQDPNAGQNGDTGTGSGNTDGQGSDPGSNTDPNDSNPDNNNTTVGESYDPNASGF